MSAQPNPAAVVIDKQFLLDRSCKRPAKYSCTALLVSLKNKAG